MPATPSQPENIVIAGAGQAAANAAAELRRRGFAGSITLVGDEAHPPYERPQLSKALLASDRTEAKFMRADEDYARDGIALLLGARISTVDPQARTVELEDGRTLGYDRLVIATGVRPRQLPPALHASPRVRYLRNLADAARLRDDLEAGGPLAIIGGGVIGLEVAAAARSRGIPVTVVEAGARLMQRGVEPLVSAWLDCAHRARGVDIRYGVQAVAIDGERLLLSDGGSVPAHSVLACIGVTPNIEPFAQLGIADEFGIRVDAAGCTAVAGIHAIGDIASQPAADGGCGRVETWANAQDHAIAVARNLLAPAEPYAAPSWFWSDQGDINLQVLGDPSAGGAVVRGDAEAEAFSVFRLDAGGCVLGCTTVNAPKDMAMARRWLREGRALDPARLSDAAIPLRDCAA